MACGKLGELLVVQAAAGPVLQFAIEAGQAVFDVGGVLGSALLSVVDNIDADVHLFLGDFGDGVLGFGGENVHVQLNTVLPGA